MARKRNKVVKCICHKRSFEEVKAYAAEHNLNTLEELKDRNYCSTNCGLCGPYVKLLLKTGKTEFNPGEPYLTK